MPGFIGFPELVLLALVCLVLFGPKRLPEMGRGLGKGMREFKNSINGDAQSVDVAKLEPPQSAVELHTDDLHKVA